MNTKQYKEFKEIKISDLYLYTDWEPIHFYNKPFSYYSQHYSPINTAYSNIEYYYEPYVLIGLKHENNFDECQYLRKINDELMLKEYKRFIEDRTTISNLKLKLKKYE